MGTFQHILLIVASGGGFAASTIMIKQAVETASLQWLVAGMAALVAAYLPWLKLLDHSMVSTVIVTGILSQCIVVAYGFTFAGEAMTLQKICGLILALCTIIAFSWPEVGKV